MEQSQGDLLPDNLEELFEEFSEDLVAEAPDIKLLTHTKVFKKDRIRSITCSIKSEYYRVYRRMCDLPSNPYIFREIKDVLNYSPEFAEKNVKLFGIYKYDPECASHSLYNTTILNNSIENPARIELIVDSLEKCPVVGAHVEVYGEIVLSPEKNSVIVNFFHEIREDYSQEYQELLRRQAICSSQ